MPADLNSLYQIVAGGETQVRRYEFAADGPKSVTINPYNGSYSNLSQRSSAMKAAYRLVTGLKDKIDLDGETTPELIRNCVSFGFEASGWRA